MPPAGEAFSYDSELRRGAFSYFIINRIAPADCQGRGRRPKGLRKSCFTERIVRKQEIMVKKAIICSSLPILEIKRQEIIVIKR